MQFLDLIVIVGYLALILFLGGSFFSKNRTAGSFTLGSGKVPSLFGDGTGHYPTWN